MLRTFVAAACVGGVIGMTGCGTSREVVPQPVPPPSPQSSSPQSPGPTMAPQLPGAPDPSVGGSQAPKAPASVGPAGPRTPTSTGTVPPPPKLTGPAATRAGSLSEANVPVPAGWNKTALPGGADQGFIGNGTWVYAKSAVNAAYEALAVGCAPVEVDAYTPPKAALAGTLAGKSGQPGNALTLEFADANGARAYYEQFVTQLQACTAAGSSPKVSYDRRGDQFIGKRDYGSGQVWTEFGKVSNTKVALYILADPAYAPADAEAVLNRIG